jgi:hypothetical protein
MGTGIYFLNKKCALLFLHGNNRGMFFEPPYLDVHGEVDMGLRYFCKHSFYELDAEDLFI